MTPTKEVILRNKYREEIGKERIVTFYDDCVKPKCDFSNSKSDTVFVCSTSPPFGKFPMVLKTIHEFCHQD